MKNYRESWAIFECHSYSRMKDHLQDFAHSLSFFDHVIVANIYAARENNIYGVTEDDLVLLLQESGVDAIHLQTYEEMKSYLEKRVKENDLLITIGAGTITNFAKELVK